jgi:RNA polymerase-binding transcription factor DksA
MRQTFDELVAAADLEPPDDEHDPDGTTAYERAQVSSLQGLSERGAATLERTLHDLDAGIYGSCSICHRAIAFDRLVAVLGTDRCVACAAGRA